MADLAKLAKGLSPTIPTFWQDSYRTTGEFKILRTAPDEKKHYTVLDETVMYPKGGGQPSDKGILIG